MLKKRIIFSLTFKDGILFRTKKFIPDYRYTKNFIDLWNIDELILVDVSKEKFKKSFLEVVNFFSTNCFVPIAVGGGIKSINDATVYFDNGADKIILSSRTFINHNIITSISTKYGNQSIIQSIDFVKIDNNYFLSVESGTKLLDIEPDKWILNSIKLGAGEILLNSVNNDGGLLGYDLKFITKITKNINHPFLALGGCGNWDHVLELFSTTNVSAACTQNIYHFTDESISSLKNFLKKNNISIRK